MPIRPEERIRYPTDWPQISHRIRFERAAGFCECAGECSRHPGRACAAVHGEAHPVTGSLVVLTVAHLDHTPENCDPANLKAMCQRCHLAYDQDLHAVNAARTRFAKLTAGMTPLLNIAPIPGAGRVTTLIAVYNSEGLVGHCDTKCYQAREPDCHCICQGRNHGAGYQTALTNTRQHAERWIEHARVAGWPIDHTELDHTVSHDALFDLPP